VATMLYDRAVCHENGGICITLSPTHGFLFDMGAEIGILP